MVNEELQVHFEEIVACKLVTTVCKLSIVRYDIMYQKAYSYVILSFNQFKRFQCTFLCLISVRL